MKKKRNVIGLLGCFCINNILYMFLNTFMVAYFISLTNYNYRLISIYYIMNFIFIATTFYLLGFIVKKHSKIIIFRMGIVLYCLYIILIALLKEKIIDYYIYLGACYGIVQGVLWAPGLSLVNEYVKDESTNFVSLKSMLTQVLKVIVPFILGTSIELISFTYTAIIIVFLSVIQFFFSLLIKEEKKIKKEKFELNKYIKYIRKNSLLRTYYKLVACDGIVNYMLATVVTILIVTTFKSSFNLGVLTTVFSFFSILSVYIFQRKIKTNINIAKISAIMMVISLIALLIDINKYTIILYNFFNSIFLILLINKAEAKRYEIINVDKKASNSYIVEHQIFSEICLNIARITGYLFLFFASLFNKMLVFKLLLVMITIMIVVYAKLINNIDNNDI